MTKTTAKRAAPATKKTRASASPAVLPVPAAAPAHPAKTKLVRDSFTIPKLEYATLDALKLRAAGLGHPAKKSEVIRAGISLLAGLSDKALMRALQAVPSLKTGRPKAVVPDPAEQ